MIKNSDKWLVQSGYVASPTNAQTINLIKSYQDVNYTIITSNADKSNRRWASAGINSKSQIWVMASASSSTASSTPCFWYTQGYAE